MSEIHWPAKPNTRILILVSGEGSNMKALVEAADEWDSTVVAVGADRECVGIDWAADRGIPTFVLPFTKGDDRSLWDETLAHTIRTFDPDLLVCAGFLKLLGPAVLETCPGRILNTHNSLLPAFPGINGPADAVVAGVKLAGATLFVVDPGIDTGQIIAQTAVPVEYDDTAETLLERIKDAERVQLVESVGRMIHEGWTTNDRRVRFGN